jgi:competence protein ComEC
MGFGALGLGLSVRTHRSAQPRLRVIAAWCGPASLAAIVTAFVAQSELDTRWPLQVAGERVIGVMTIDSLIEGEGDRLAFEAKLRIESPDTLARTLRVQVHWAQPPRPLPQVGESWRVLARLAPPLASRNPGGYDAARQAFVERIHARAHVLSWAATTRIAPSQPSLLRWRSRIAESIRERIVDRDAAALFAGLAVGATEAVSPEQWRVFSVTGTTHLVAISGMHVTLFAWLMAGVARRLWNHIPPLMYYFDREFFAGVLGVSAAILYALLAGFGVPTQRTVVMLLIWWGMRLAGRHHSDLTVLGLALVAVWLIDPLAPLSAGFWLSFVAMATLMSTSADPQRAGRGRLGQSVLNLLRTQWRIGIALLPLTLLWFQSIPLAGLWVNLLAIPIFSFVLVPLVLLGTVWQSIWFEGARPIWWLAELIHTLIWPPMHAIAQSDWAALHRVMPTAWTLLAACAVALWLWRPASHSAQRQFIWRWPAIAGISAILLISAAARPSVPEGDLWVRILDAGDSTAVILRTRNFVIVYDTGESFGSQGSGARGRVIPALREWGVDSVDVLVLGSLSNLRLLGAATLSGLFTVKEIRHPSIWHGPPPIARACDRKLTWERDGVEFQLRPAGDAGQFCLLRAMPRGGPALVLAERLDREAARALASEDPAFLTTHWLLAPRRGSVNALSSEFVTATSPERILVSARVWSDRQQAAAAHRWGLAPSRFFATAVDGALTLRLSATQAAELESYGGKTRMGVWRASH